MKRQALSISAILIASVTIGSGTECREDPITKLVKRPDVITAAKKAVSCLGWPDGVQDRASKIKLIRAPEAQPIETAPMPSNSVTVGPSGCNDVEIVVFNLTGTAAYSANVYAPDLTMDSDLYVLFLARADTKKGEFTFYGIRSFVARGHSKPMAPVDRYTVSFGPE